jgi:hypothetical protein
MTEDMGDQWSEANALWDKATDALLARNYERFDALMHDIKAITRTWKSTREPGLVNSPGRNQ